VSVNDKSITNTSKLFALMMTTVNSIVIIATLQGFLITLLWRAWKNEITIIIIIYLKIVHQVQHNKPYKQQQMTKLTNQIDCQQQTREIGKWLLNLNI